MWILSEGNVCRSSYVIRVCILLRAYIENHLAEEIETLPHVIWPCDIAVTLLRSIGRFSKILNFHPIDSKFEEDLHIKSLKSTTIFQVNIGQMVNTGQISNIINFHPIDLKFEQDFHIKSLNSTTNYFLRSTLARFLKSSIFIRLTWNLNKIFINMTIMCHVVWQPLLDRRENLWRRNRLTDQCKI